MINYRQQNLSKDDANRLRTYLDPKVSLYNTPKFIESDPISIPHLFSEKQDIEIAGFFSAILAWGRRKTIINKATELVELMDMAPFEFITNHRPKDRLRFKGFKHRTFKYDDMLHFLEFFQRHYKKHNSLEKAFFSSEGSSQKSDVIEMSLIQFKKLFFSTDHLARTRKHISSPETNAACKRLVMFLRWMVRKDNCGVDFGIWNAFDPSQLYIPLDVHVFKIAKQLQITDYHAPSWKAVKQITGILKTLDPFDPAKYDFALFNMGLVEG